MRSIMAILLLLTAPAFADRASEDALLAKARSTYLNDPAMEKNALAASQGRASRQGEVLTLTRATGKPVTLRNHLKPCDGISEEPVGDCLRFNLVADLPSRHAYVVAKAGYEGCAELLLVDDRKGRQTTFADVPVFSPDDERLLIQNECEMDGSVSENHFEIWKRAGDGWALEWFYTTEQAMAADKTLKTMFSSNVVSWRGNRIDLTLSAPAYGQSEARHWTGTLTRIHGRWVLKAGKLHSP